MSDRSMSDQIVYISGPMFSIGDKWEQDQIAAALESHGCKTYLPPRDGIEVGQLMALLNDPNISTDVAQMGLAIVRRCVFALDMYQLIERCTCAVFNVDGRVPDEGSVVETAAAYAAGKPIVTFKSTPISFIAGQDNPMVDGLSYTWLNCSKLEDIADALKRIIKLLSIGSYHFKQPPKLALVIDLGRDISLSSSDFKQILEAVIKAAPADRLAKVKALLDWAKNSQLYQNAFGGKLSPPAPSGNQIQSVL